MILNFREWFESRRAATVHPEIKKWIDSADKLKQTVEKLKAIIKDKEAKAKTAKPVEPEKKSDIKKPESKERPPEKPEIKKPEIKDKPKDKVVEPKVKIEPKNIEKPTKVEKGKKIPEKEGLEDERSRRDSDAGFSN